MRAQGLTKGLPQTFRKVCPKLFSGGPCSLTARGRVLSVRLRDGVSGPKHQTPHCKPSAPNLEQTHGVGGILLNQRKPDLFRVQGSGCGA